MVWYFEVGEVEELGEVILLGFSNFLVNFLEVMCLVGRKYIGESCRSGKVFLLLFLVLGTRIWNLEKLKHIVLRSGPTRPIEPLVE